MVLLVTTRYEHNDTFRNTKDMAVSAWDTVKGVIDAAIDKGKCACWTSQRLLRWQLSQI